jgi:hypothetical protein
VVGTGTIVTGAFSLLTAAPRLQKPLDDPSRRSRR